MTDKTQDALVERVARAIYLALYGSKGGVWHAVADEHKENPWREAARAAIAEVSPTPSNDVAEAARVLLKHAERERTAEAAYQHSRGETIRAWSELPEYERRDILGNFVMAALTEGERD